MKNFGDIFRYSEDLYVYLIETDDLIFAAKIIPEETTRQLVNLRETRSRNPQNRTHEKLLYCFVVLSTFEFQNQGAHYGNPPMPKDVSKGVEWISRLNDEDIHLLQDEIKQDSVTYPVLRKIISQFFSEKNG